MGRKGQVEEVAQLVKGVGLQLVKVKHLPVRGLLDENGLSHPMLVAHADVVVEGELDGRSDCSPLSALLNDDVFPVLLPALFAELQKNAVEVFVDGVGNDGLLPLELLEDLEQVHLNFVVGKLAEENDALRKHELPKNLPKRSKHASLLHLQRPLLVVHLRSAVVALGVSLGNHEVFPPLLQVGVVDSFHLHSLGSKCVSAVEVASVDDAGKSHDPVGDSCEVFDEVERPSELLIGGSCCIRKAVRGIERKRGVIIVIYIDEA